MGATLVRIDGVGEGVHRLRISAVPLHRDFDFVARALALEVDDALLNWAFGAVDVLDEVDQAAGVVESAMLDLVRTLRFGRLFFGGLGRFGSIANHIVDDVFLGHPFVGEIDRQTLVEKRHLLQPAGHRLEVVFSSFEDLRIGPEPDRGSGFLGRLTLLQGAGHGVVVNLRPLVAIPGNIDLEQLRQGIDHRNADTMQAATDVVAAVLATELAAGVQLRHNHIDGRNPGRVHGDRNAAAVISDLDTTVVE